MSRPYVLSPRCKMHLKQLWNNAEFHRYFANTSWLLAEKGLRMAVGLFVGVWVARYLGPARLGLLSYAQSFVGLFAAISTLGLDGIVVRELVKDGSSRDRLLGTAFWLKLAGAIVLLIVLTGATRLVANDSHTNLLIFIIASATVFQCFNVIDLFFQAHVLSKYAVFANFIALFFTSIVKIILILLEKPLTYFAAVTLFDSLVLACGYLYMYWFTGVDFRQWKFDKALAYRLLQESWPLIFSSAVLMVQARIDQVMLKQISGNVETGYYSVALRIVETFGVIPIVLKTSLSPLIFEAKKTSSALYRKRLVNFYKINFQIFLIIAIPLFLFAEKIVVLLYSPEYQSAGILLALMAFRLFFTNMGVARGVYIITESLFRFSLFTMTIGTIVNITLNYYWIETYGGKGAIFATIISFAVTTFALDALYPRTRGNVCLMFKGIRNFYHLNWINADT